MSWLAEAIRTQTNDIGDAITNTPNRVKINDLRTAYRTAIDAVRGDASLSELGKAQMIARAWRNTRAEIARLSQLDYDTLVARFNTLEKQVFGMSATTGADAVSSRDADDRAAKLTRQDAALTALGNADIKGDGVLSQAIVLKAWQENWTDVVDQYASNHPTVTDQLAELGALRTTLTSQASKLGGNIGSSLLPKPAELQNLSPGQLNDYATADPSLSLTAVQAARTNGAASPRDEANARQQALDEARSHTL